MIQWDINGIYHLVMTNSLPWKDPPMLLRTVNPGKPSISIRAIYTTAMLNNQRVITYGENGHHIWKWTMICLMEKGGKCHKKMVLVLGIRHDETT